MQGMLAVWVGGGGKFPPNKIHIDLFRNHDPLSPLLLIVSRNVLAKDIDESFYIKRFVEIYYISCQIEIYLKCNLSLGVN